MSTLNFVYGIEVECPCDNDSYRDDVDVKITNDLIKTFCVEGVDYQLFLVYGIVLNNDLVYDGKHGASMKFPSTDLQITEKHKQIMNEFIEANRHVKGSIFTDKEDDDTSSVDDEQYLFENVKKDEFHIICVMNPPKPYYGA